MMRANSIVFLLLTTTLIGLTGCDQAPKQGNETAVIDSSAPFEGDNESPAVLYQKARKIIADFPDDETKLGIASGMMERASVMGYVPAMLGFAELRETGRGAPLDIPGAVNEYTRAAEAGSAQAQYKLGKYYLGDDYYRDEAKAYQWLNKAVNQGHPLAQFKLGTMMIETEGEYSNPVRAIQLFNKSAHENVLRSQVALGVIYAEGMAGSRRMPESGYQWLLLASKRGLPERAANVVNPKIEALAKEIGPDAVQRRQQWVESWLARHPDNKPELKDPDI